MSRHHYAFYWLVVLLIIVGCSRLPKANANLLAMQSDKGAAGQAPAAGKTSPAPAAELKPESFPDVVAEVNGQPVKKADLLEQIKMAESQMGRVSPEKKNDFIKAVLEDMIAQKLIIQDAQAKNLSPSKEDLDKQLGELKKQFKDEATFTEALKRDGLTEEGLRQKVAERLTLQKYVETVVVPKVTINDAEARKFYESNPDKMQGPEQVRASHILIRVDPKADAKTKKEARDKADALLKRVRANEDFAALAKANSDDPGSKENGGDLDYFSKGQMVPEFDKAAWALKTGEVSEVVETQYGYHIIKVTDRKAAQVVPFEQAKEQIKEYLKRKGVSDNLQTIVTDLKAKGKVKVMI